MIKLYFEPNCECNIINDNEEYFFEDYENILSALDGGWPICPECEEDMIFTHGEGNCLKENQQ